LSEEKITPARFAKSVHGDKASKNNRRRRRQQNPINVFDEFFEHTKLPLEAK